MFGLKNFGILVALALAVALSGCGGASYDVSGAWFAKPFDFFGRDSGYTYSELQESRKERPIAAPDLVDSHGACAGSVTQAQIQPSPGDTGGSPQMPADGASMLVGGLALGMSECEVVHRVGQPTNVQISSEANGDRLVVMTYDGGPRPGIYRFERGRLMEMDSVQVAAPAPKTVKKKPPKAKKTAKNNNAA